MNDRHCVDFLRDVLPRLRMCWAGYRKVRRQVCKRVQRRFDELGLPDVGAYRAYLETHEAEWPILDRCCRITISRFYRDRAVWQSLEQGVMPALAREACRRGRRTLRIASAGCGSGEEPYTLALMWGLSLARLFPDIVLRILAMDVDTAVLERAGRACYSRGSLKDLPAAWQNAAFVTNDDERCLRAAHRELVEFIARDVRDGLPAPPYAAVFCRNLAFTYFDDGLRNELGSVFCEALEPGGALVIGSHERLPPGVDGFDPWPRCPAIYQKRAAV